MLNDITTFVQQNTTNGRYMFVHLSSKYCIVLTNENTVQKKFTVVNNNFIHKRVRFYTHWFDDKHMYIHTSIVQSYKKATNQTELLIILTNTEEKRTKKSMLAFTMREGFFIQINVTNRAIYIAGSKYDLNNKQSYEQQLRGELRALPSFQYVSKLIDFILSC